MSNKKLVLAYSGGLDTSVAIRWLKDKGWDVIAFTVDLGEKKDLDAIQARALKIGASAAYVADGRIPFLELFVWPSLQAGAVYEKEYPLATALGRPLIAAMMVEVARREGATRDRARLHRQGQRPGALRRHHRRAGAGPRGRRAGARVGDEPRRRDRVRGQARHRGPGHHPVALLDRREPVGPLDRGRRPRGPLGGAAGRRLRVDARPAPVPRRARLRRDRLQGGPAGLARRQSRSARWSS